MILTQSTYCMEQALLLPRHSATESTMGRNSQDLDFQRHVRKMRHLRVQLWKVLILCQSPLRAEGAAHLAGSPRISHGKTLAVRPPATLRHHFFMWCCWSFLPYRLNTWANDPPPQTKRKKLLGCSELWTRLARSDQSQKSFWTKEKDHGDGEQMERKGRAPTTQITVQVLRH